jgi:hypothetical protein
MVPGAAAVLTGTNFNATPASNAVTIGGRTATVTGGTATTLNIIVPCVANGTQNIQVTTGGMRGAVHPHPVATTQRTIGVGQLLVLDTSTDSYCNELTSANGAARYVVAAFSASTSTASNAPFQLSGDAGQSLVTPYIGQPAPAVKSISVNTPLQPLTTIAAAEKRANDRHTALLEQDSAMYARVRSGAAAVKTPAAARRFSGPSVTRTFRVPNINVAGLCNSYYVISATLVTYAGKVAIYEDDATPITFKSTVNPTMAASYQKIQDQFNADFEPLIKNNFGDLLRRDAVTDNDGMVTLLFTPRINSSFSGVSGFVVSCDQFPNDDLTSPAVGGPYTGSGTFGSSNFGEVFYGYQPAVAGTGYGSNTPDNWYRTIRSTVVHEMKHLASMAARVANNAPTFEAGWLEEGTARLAEEMWMRDRVDNVGWKANTGYGDFGNPINLYCDSRPGFAECDANTRRPAQIMYRHFTSLYTNMFGTNARLLSPFGATSSDTQSYYYATAWSLVRYAIDRYGASDASFLTALTQSTTSGVTNLTAQAAGVSIDKLLGGWAMSLYTDDYPGLASPSADIQMPTWNFRSIYAGLNADFPATYTSPYSLVPQPRTFGTFAPVSVATMRGGGVIWYEISGTQSAGQLLRLEASGGGLPSSTLRLAISRIQ